MHFPIPRRNAWGELVPAKKYDELHLPEFYHPTPAASPLVADSTNEAFTLKFAFGAKYPRAHPARLSQSLEFMHDSSALSAKLACSQAILIHRIRILEDAETASAAAAAHTAFNDAAVAALTTDDFLSASLDVSPWRLHTWGTDYTITWSGSWSGLAGSPLTSSTATTVGTGVDASGASDAGGVGAGWGVDAGWGPPAAWDLVPTGDWGSGQAWGTAEGWGWAGPHFACNRGRSRRRAQFGLRPRFPERRSPRLTLARHHRLVSRALRLLKKSHTE
ncbi:hypothetical protein B0H11DRAFT_1939937 [Mycena galericulata]|nr:hypothetical protein B0H11DRAFT_1939937 [Mycena galericulata]